MSSSSSLYGTRNKPKLPTSTSSTPSSSSSTLFSSTLSSLLSQPPSSTTTSARARPSKTKTDIFTTHNKGSKKRALADLSSSSGDNRSLDQKHAASIEGIDPSSWHRSKRKMEEKARLYAAMKRGDYVPRAGRENKEELGLVDFDRKWAEKEDNQDGHKSNTSSASDDDGGDSTEAAEEEETLVEYEDEFGRLRKGTQASASREQRRRNAQAYAEAQLASFSARPSRPENVIVGDTIQAAAFNPDANLTRRMESLAAKRDRSPTPPEAVHYDASKEIRSKGVGFYAFSQDAENRAKEMEDLGRERRETERLTREREGRKEAKKRMVEERKREIAKRREERLADRFLSGLDPPGL
ncbi:MAG: hypothetical protein Q9191_004262 [Dirinaria sp. TL-2023a]